MRTLAALIALGIAVPAIAQTTAAPSVPGAPDSQRVAAGSYKLDPNHSQVMFAIDHMGFSIFRGLFTQASGTLSLDPANLTTAQVSISIPIASVQTSNEKLNGELVSSDWFDAAKFPNATFTSTRVTIGPDNTALVDGNLTLHGVTKPERMQVRFHGAGTNPLDKAQTVGFDARLAIKRSEFGVSKYVPLVSDRVELTIVGAFEKQ
jgi:polyisoprenoid-binding protein YceI